MHNTLNFRIFGYGEEKIRVQATSFGSVYVG